ncbi:Transgelin, partial [Operophtera brumata]
LVNDIQPNTVKKVNTSKMAFKCMENINAFLEAAKNLGVPAQETFQTVDLWERQNLNSVVICLQSLGRKVGFPSYLGKPYLGSLLTQTFEQLQAGSHGKPSIGPKESEKNVRNFSEEQLRAGQGVISLQYGSNKGATQSGINFGNTRHM